MKIKDVKALIVEGGPNPPEVCSEGAQSSDVRARGIEFDLDKISKVTEV